VGPAWCGTGGAIGVVLGALWQPFYRLFFGAVAFLIFASICFGVIPQMERNYRNAERMIATHEKTQAMLLEMMEMLKKGKGD
jgi:hypothetical protein